MASIAYLSQKICTNIGRKKMCISSVVQWTVSRVAYIRRVSERQDKQKREKKMQRFAWIRIECMRQLIMHIFECQEINNNMTHRSNNDEWKKKKKILTKHSHSRTQSLRVAFNACICDVRSAMQWYSMCECYVYDWPCCVMYSEQCKEII